MEIMIWSQNLNHSTILALMEYDSFCANADKELTDFHVLDPRRSSSIANSDSKGSSSS